MRRYPLPLPAQTEPVNLTPYYCTDCENHIRKLHNGRCGCGSGRVVSAPATAPLAVDQAMRVEPREAALVEYPLLDSESDNDVSLARGALRQGFIAGYRAALKQEGSK